MCLGWLAGYSLSCRSRAFGDGFGIKTRVIMNDRFAEALGKQLIQLYGGPIQKKARFESTPLDEGVLLRIREDDTLSQMILYTSKIGVRKGKALVLVKGQLFKPKGEYIQFRNLLALPEASPTGEHKLAPADGVTADLIVDMRGIVVTPEGKRLEFHNRDEDFFEKLSWPSEKKSGCSGCSKQHPMRIIQLERRIKESRCWLCTGIALLLGVFTSASLTWLVGGLLKWLDTTALQSLVFTGGMLFTGWRVWYWGYLPFQNRAAHLLGLSRR